MIAITSSFDCSSYCFILVWKISYAALLEGKLNWEMDTIADVKKKQGDINWPRNYAALLEYHKEYGTCNVPTNAVYECDLEGMGEDEGVYHYNGRLGRWLNTQRKAKKSTGRRQTPERQALLQKLFDEGKCEFACVCVCVFL